MNGNGMSENYYSSTNVVSGVGGFRELMLPLPLNIALGIKNWRQGVQWDKWRTSNRRHKEFIEWDDIYVTNLRGECPAKMGDHLDKARVKDLGDEFYHCFEPLAPPENVYIFPVAPAEDPLDTDEKIIAWLYEMYPQYMRNEGDSYLANQD